MPKWIMQLAIANTFMGMSIVLQNLNTWGSYAPFAGPPRFPPRR